MRGGKAWKLCAGLYLRIGTVIHKTHLLLTALTTAVTDTVASGFTYRTTSQGKKKERKKINKTSNPSRPPKQHHVCMYMGSSVPKGWNKMYGKPGACSKPSKPVRRSHSVHIQLTQGFWKMLNMLLPVNRPCTRLLCMNGRSLWASSWLWGETRCLASKKFEAALS